MKFVSSKSVAERVVELSQCKDKIRQLREELRAEVERKVALEDFLERKADDDGLTLRYGGTSLAIEFGGYTKEVLDQEKAMRLIRKAGYKVPMNEVWVRQVSITVGE